MGAFWDTFTESILDYAMSAYDGVEPWTYPFIFVGIIGFIYAFSGSVTVAVVGILITLGLFGASVFADVPDVSIFLYIITILGIALLVTTLYIKRRG